MIDPTAPSLEPAPAMFVFTGETRIHTRRQHRYGGGRDERFQSAPVEVAVLAADQPDAERAVAAMLSTPADDRDGYGAKIDTHERRFTWTSAQQAPADAAALEVTRTELQRTVALLDEAQSAGRLALQQADAERERGDVFMATVDRVRAMHLPAGKPAVCVHCTSAGGPQYAYPCPTIRAVEGES